MSAIVLQQVLWIIKIFTSF